MDHHSWRLPLPLGLEMGMEERFAASGPRPHQWAAMARAPQAVPGPQLTHQRRSEGLESPEAER